MSFRLFLEIKNITGKFSAFLTLSSQPQPRVTSREGRINWIYKEVNFNGEKANSHQETSHQDDHSVRPQYQVDLSVDLLKIFSLNNVLYYPALCDSNITLYIPRILNVKINNKCCAVQ